MGTLLLLAILGHTRVAPVAQISGNMLWEELPAIQKFPSYHPALRYYGSSRFMFKTPYYIAEGHYSLDGAHYTFRPETAIELNHADVDKLAAEYDPETRRKKLEDYGKSLTPFDGDYDPGQQMLTLHYVVDGVPKTFSLYKFTVGDDSLSSNGSSNQDVVGLWYTPDPYPEKLDSKTRYRIDGLDGLKRFSKEAAMSDGSQFGIMDIKVDGTYRNFSTVSGWKKSGSTLVLTTEKGGHIEFAINGNKLMKDGRIAYVKS
ncbi:MAG TPA: hypothetical protein VGL56_11790 [Fimbriimonadaceae bacterium]|jgi:hypothetical protein